MSPNKEERFFASRRPSHHFVDGDGASATDNAGRTNLNQDRVQLEGRIGDAHRTLFSPFSSLEDKKQARKVLRENGVEIGEAALRKLGLD